MKYKYVIFGYERDYFSIMFEDAVSCGIAEYISNPILDKYKNPFIRNLYKIHTHRLLNWKFKIPFKSLWFPYFYDSVATGPICFIFLMDWVTKENIKLFKKLRESYPDCKLVVYFEDLVSSRPNFDVNLLKHFDFGITYDQKDSKKYNLLYHPTFLSKIEVKSIHRNPSDVCFVGIAKDRLPQIHNLFNFLQNCGLKTDFVVSRKNKEDKIEDGIQYISKDISYREYLNHVINSNCILEIMHHDAGGYTLRTWEALLYNKKLITNNKNILNAPFYRSDQFFYFEKPEDISISWLKKDLQKNDFNLSSISPLNFIKFLDNLL